MSWSINFIGKAEEVIKSLDDYSVKLQGPGGEQSKLEYDEALPHLKALVLQNFGFDRTIEISANGSGWAEGGEQKNRSLYCTIR